MNECSCWSPGLSRLKPGLQRRLTTKLRHYRLAAELALLLPITGTISHFHREGVCAAAKFQFVSIQPAGDQPKAIAGWSKAQKTSLSVCPVRREPAKLSRREVIEQLNRPTLVQLITRHWPLSTYRSFAASSLTTPSASSSATDYSSPSLHPAASTSKRLQHQRASIVCAFGHQQARIRQDVIVVASVSCIYGLGSPPTTSE